MLRQLMRRVSSRYRRRVVIAAVMLFVVAPTMAAQDTLPFGIGERLTYKVRVDRMRASGRGVMWIEGLTEFRGAPTMLLRSSVEVGIGPIKAIDKTDSWFDPSRMAALRFEQQHRYLFSRRRSAVDIYPEEMRWRDSSGVDRTSLSDAPLDELSFIYYVRTLTLGADSAWSVNRHYDEDRNPVCIRVLGRDTISIPLGEFQVIVAELRVKDPRFTGEGVIRLFLTDDGDRVPVRIESALPGLGTALFTLESFERAPARLTAAAR